MPNQKEQARALRERERLVEEGLRPIVDVAAAHGVRVHAKTAIRWAVHGLRGVPLQAVKIAGCWMTSAPAFCRFVARAQEPLEGEPTVQIDTDDAAAEALERHGLAG